MPHYHFDLIDSKIVMDQGGQELRDDSTAKRIAKVLAVSLRLARPELRNGNFEIIVTNQDGEIICRVPLDLPNWKFPSTPAQLRPQAESNEHTAYRTSRVSFDQ